MEKKYKEIEFNCGCTIKEAVLDLIKHAQREEFVCGSFNGHMLYSDTVSLDSAFLEITGKTFFENINRERINRERLIEEEKEYKKTIPTETKTWINKGHKIIDKKYWERWDMIVPIRLSDLYHGMELGACLDIIEPLNNDCKLSHAKNIIEEQNHSGMSFSLIKSMVKEFCDRGNDFYKFVE